VVYTVRVTKTKMLLHKTTITLLKGLLLFVLVSSPTTSIPHINGINNPVNPSQYVASSPKKLAEIKVDAQETIEESQKYHYASYDCSEEGYKSLLDEINRYREANSILDATNDGQLNSVACAHSKWMDETKVFSNRGYDNKNAKIRCMRAETACNDEIIMKIENLNSKQILTQIKESNENAYLLDPDNKNIGFGLENGYLTILFR
jgi:uncharacterized protein YkwD